MNEHNQQRLLVAWFRATYPQYESVFFAIPNGGKRDPVTAKRLKEERVLPGVPDLMLAVPRGKYHGLFMELKTLTGRTKKSQERINGALAGQGYCVHVAHGYQRAVTMIEYYLSLCPP